MRSDKPSNSAIRQLYYDIPVDAYPYLAKELGYKRYHSIVDMLSNRRPMSMNFYNRIQDAFKVYLAKVQFSTKKKDGIFDAIQTQSYYKGLVDLMNSQDYILLSPSKRTLILEEQKRIYKQLNR